jgi:squalene-associated FAD-dependent desaturase
VSARVVVIGGGFAGLAAACRLAGEGFRPTLYERAARLGGRAASFHDRASGVDVDYAHHVSMRCCTATHGFLQRIRATSAVRHQPELSVPILCGGARSRLRSTPLLPGAAHLVPALLAYPFLTARERLAVLRAGVALRLDARCDEPFGEWLRGRRQPPHAIERLWDPICVATLNAHVDEVGVRAARKVFLDGFFNPHGAGLGLFTGPLSRVFDAASIYVESHEGVIRTSTTVRRIHVTGAHVSSVELADGETFEADAVVTAIPPWDLAGLVSEGALGATLDRAKRLAWSPIVDVHLWFDRPVLDDEFVMAVDSPIQAVFNLSRIHSRHALCIGKGRSTDRPSPKQLRPEGGVAPHLVLSQSAAAPWIDRSADEIADELISALGDLVPDVGAARVERRLVIKHRRATFVPAPGADALRPSAKTPIEGLYLAGDWTATGWPSTIEGAILSGIIGAGRAEESLREDSEAPEDDPT